MSVVTGTREVGVMIDPKQGRTGVALGHVGDPTMTERALPVGTSRCLCRACGRYFGGVFAFDRHQTLADDGSVICHDPSTRGLVVTVSGGHSWWSGKTPMSFRKRS